MNQSRHAEWLTIPQVCTYLGIAAEEWDEVRPEGHAPLHVTDTYGELRVRADHLERWLDSLPPASPEEFFAGIEAYLNEHNAWANDEQDDNTDTSARARADASRSTTADASAVSIRLRDELL